MVAIINAISFLSFFFSASPRQFSHRSRRLIVWCISWTSVTQSGIRSVRLRSTWPSSDLLDHPQMTARSMESVIWHYPEPSPCRENSRIWKLQWPHLSLSHTHKAKQRTKRMLDQKRGLTGWWTRGAREGEGGAAGGGGSHGETVDLKIARVIKTQERYLFQIFSAGQ